MKVVWQNYLDNRYQIVMRRLINDTLDNKTIIKDSLLTNPQISISAYRMVWIENNCLYSINFYPDISNPVLIDSLDCSSPNIIKDDDINSTKILYSKEINGNQLIYAASYNEYPDHSWSKGVFSNGQNANFGDLGGVSFEIIEHDVSKIKYSSSASYFTITTNETCNYKNPYVFTYLQPITKSSLNNRTPYFVAFDTDSLDNNNEIFIKTFYLYDSLINISNMEGNDYKPQAAFITINDTDYVAIFWLHEENEKINIWLAKDVFNPVYVSVKDENIEPKSFELMQNYPNPFNPKTIITFYVKEYSKVNIKVYDILGKHIGTILNDYKSAGTYKVLFSGDNLSSGIYFYTMSVNGITKTKSMLLLK